MNNTKTYTIRSITYSIDLDKIAKNDYWDEVKNDFIFLSQSFEANGFKIRTLRISRPFIYLNDNVRS